MAVRPWFLFSYNNVWVEHKVCNLLGIGLIGVKQNRAPRRTLLVSAQCSLSLGNPAAYFGELYSRLNEPI
jgi:hypothetical protein